MPMVSLTRLFSCHACSFIQGYTGSPETKPSKATPIRLLRVADNPQIDFFVCLTCFVISNQSLLRSPGCPQILDPPVSATPHLQPPMGWQVCTGTLDVLATSLLL